MSMLWTNNASSVLASDITAGTLSITVTAGHGDRFPAVAAPHYFNVTLVDTSGNREIVKVTARTTGSNTMTITRAQESTSARSFAAGSLVELRITKNAMDEVSKAADINAQHYVCDASAVDQGATTNANSLKSIIDSLGATEEATIELPHAGTGDTTTYTVGTNLTIPATVTLVVHKGARVTPSGGVTLTVNGIVQAGAYQIFAGAGTVTVSTYPQDQAWWGSAQRLDGNINGFSVDNTALRATHDPYPAAAENLPVSLQEEIQSIRYLLQQITGKTYWYQDPDTTIASLSSQNPPGTVLPYAGATAPTGYLLCYGQTVSQAAYPALYAIIGHTYSADPGGGNFILPDMRGHLPLGKDNMGGSSANRVAASYADNLGYFGGSENKDLSHVHSGPSHDHLLPFGNKSDDHFALGWRENNSGTFDQSVVIGVVGGVSSATATYNHLKSYAGGTGNTGSGGSATQNIMPPTITMNYIIKY